MSEIYGQRSYDIFDEYSTESRKKKNVIRNLEDQIWIEQRKSDEKIAGLIKEYEEKIVEKDSMIRD